MAAATRSAQPEPPAPPGSSAHRARATARCVDEPPPWFPGFAGARRAWTAPLDHRRRWCVQDGPMERIGEYLVRRLIGEGGMGKVYEAEERLSRRRVALKVLRPELSRSEQGRQMFLNEMTILAHLDHPNIVRSLSCSEV